MPLSASSHRDGASHMTQDSVNLPLLTVTKTETIEYTREYSHQELAQLLGLQPAQYSTDDLIEYIQTLAGDLGKLHEAVENTADCTSSEWTVTPQH